jgi:hypothetical protein
VFRGEEEEPGRSEDPEAKLVETLDWDYDPAPYILGEQSYISIIFII